eukprot:g34474.t1
MQSTFVWVCAPRNSPLSTESHITELLRVNLDKMHYIFLQGSFEKVHSSRRCVTVSTCRSLFKGSICGTENPGIHESFHRMGNTELSNYLERPKATGQSHPSQHQGQVEPQDIVTLGAFVPRVYAQFDVAGI